MQVTCLPGIETLRPMRSEPGFRFFGDIYACLCASEVIARARECRVAIRGRNAWARDLLTLGVVNGYEIRFRGLQAEVGPRETAKVGGRYSSRGEILNILQILFL